MSTPKRIKYKGQIYEAVSLSDKSLVENTKINETSRKSKAKQLFTEPQKSKIKTFAILTANNPDTVHYSRKANNMFNKQLKDIMSNDSPKDILDRYSFNYYKVKGSYGNIEDSFLIYNLTLDDAKTLATRFQQQSFVFGKNTDDGLIFEFYANKAKIDKNTGKPVGYIYARTDAKSIYKDELNSSELYTQIARNFKISIPFEKFNFDDDETVESLYVDCDEKDIEYSMREDLTFMGRVQGRQRFLNTPK